MNTKLVFIAIGGNSLILDKQHEDVGSQWVAVQETCRHIADMIERGWNLVITHGNGPQVGAMLDRNELSRERVPLMPLDVLVAQTEGSLGYYLQQELLNSLKRNGLRRFVVTVVTQVVVDPEDLK